MNAPHDYKPALRSVDLPAVDTSAHPSRAKTLKALVLVSVHGFMTIQHAGRGHALAFIESGPLSRWYFKRGGATAELFADLIASSDKRGRRWRVVEPISGEIRNEG